MGRPSRPPFELLEPTCPDYARLPLAAAFTWADCVSLANAGEWYLVAFRSILRDAADLDRLREYDDRAHDEARSSRGFVHYLKGPANDRGECLSFCLWTSRAHARAAAGRPAHREAVTVAHATYERYALEFLRLMKRPGVAEFEFAQYDEPSPAAPRLQSLPAAAD
jgi:hypothetical protein